MRPFCTIPALLCASCATFQPADPPAIMVGDHVRVETIDGDSLEFEVMAVGDVEILGRAADGARVVVPRDDIAALEGREVDPARSILAAAGGYVAAATLLAIITFMQLIYEP